MTDETLIWRDGEIWKREAVGARPWRELRAVAPLDPDLTERIGNCAGPDGVAPPPPLDVSDLF